jgi:ABC-2 type transport system permease protein
VIGQSWGRILAIARIETLRLLVDRPSIGLILFVPALQLVLFGYAVNLTPKNIPIAIAPSCDAQADLISRAVADTGSFRLIPTDHEPHRATQYISSGRALVAIDCGAAQAPSLAADASDPSAVRPAVAMLEAGLLGEVLRSVIPEVQPRSAVQWLYNPEARTAWSLAPGLVGVVVMITMLMLGALTLVRDREQGSWEGLLATPVTALDALLGKLAPYVIVAVAQAAIVIALARVLFGMPALGSVAVLLLASALFALAHLTLGFALSALAYSQIQAIQAAVFFYLPSMLLSGFMFPFEGMPRWAQSLGNALPLTHFVRSARGVLLKGYGASEVVAEMWPVAVFALAAAGVAIASYRRRLS